jgi:hypothetical protein
MKTFIYQSCITYLALGGKEEVKKMRIMMKIGAMAAIALFMISIIPANGATAESQADGSYDLVLDFINDESTTFELLDIDVGLDVRAATNIIAHRNGPDGVLGRGQDDLFDSKQELDDIYWVGPVGLAKIEAYVYGYTLTTEDAAVMINTAVDTIMTENNAYLTNLIYWAFGGEAYTTQWCIDYGLNKISAYLWEDMTEAIIMAYEVPYTMIGTAYASYDDAYTAVYELGNGFLEANIDLYMDAYCYSILESTC